MDDIDHHYQQAVDELVEDLLGRTSAELQGWPDYGEVEGISGPVGFWHYMLDDDTHHLVFKTERRVFQFLYRSYVSGVVFGPHKDPRLMSLEEAGAYD